LDQLLLVSSKLLLEYLVYDLHPAGLVHIIVEQMMYVFFVHVKVEKRWFSWHFLKILVVELEEVVREALPCLFLGERAITAILT
jgi:hypothetical protein